MPGAEARILSWLSALGVEPRGLMPVRGDVSPRRYFRLIGAEGVIAAYPPDLIEQAARFVATSQLFEAAGVRVPRILAADPGVGLLLLEDLGTVSLFDVEDRSWRSLRRHYFKAAEMTSLLASRPRADFAAINPALDALRLEAEVAGAQEVFLGQEEFSGSPQERRAIESAVAGLCRTFEQEPLVPSHRDFMSRNLMLTAAARELVVIDHQDSCLAPRFYDLASLLNDSYFPSAEQERELLGPVARRADDLRAYRCCAVQRALKACATFIRFARAGYPRHLPLVAPTLARAACHLERLPEGRAIPQSAYARWRSPDAVRRGLSRLAQVPQC